jgi:hypothetical protein
MKKLLIILLIVTGVSFSASAQHRYYVRHSSYPRSRISVAVGAPLYPYYGYGYYDPFYTPIYRYGYPRETKLELKIEDIRNDYEDRIWSARHNEGLSKAERRRIIHKLKHDRDVAINDAKRNYYRSY